MSEFKQYKRSQIAEIREVTDYDVSVFKSHGGKLVYQSDDGIIAEVSISQADRENGSPKIGDMIARNPKNHKDQWLIAREYFNDNFEPLH